MKFLSYDSKFMTTVRRITDFILLGMLWFVSSIPLFTFGAAATSALLTAETVIHKGEGTLWRSYWQNFRKEFRQATLLWLLAVLVLALLIADIYCLMVGQWPLVVQMMLTCALLMAYCWMQLWFGYLSKFQDNLKTLLANTIRMTLGSFPWTVLLSLISLAAVIGCVATVLILPLMLLIPGVYLIAATPIYRRIFKRYVTEEEQ